jgi:predicted transcriptional regulator
MQSPAQVLESSSLKREAVHPVPEGSWVNPNDRLIYQLLKTNGPASRDTLATRSGLPRTTVYDVLTRLTLCRLVIREKEPRQTIGRRRVIYAADE